MQGIDAKKFVFNDIRSIIIPSPTNSSQYLVTIQADVNGYTYSIATLAGVTQFTASENYGARAGQFDVQGMFYDQYQIDHVDFDLTLS